MDRQTRKEWLHQEIKALVGRLAYGQGIKGDDAKLLEYAEENKKIIEQEKKGEG
ncbi:hypothetical protein LCGC14_2310210 [marine sediment metagenome]|uniref:Uncharacterized protein n=1 Tax=marine sediment metagenome TaxID=412755 RepID=A0A0F9CLD3_9ZZZZ